MAVLLAFPVAAESGLTQSLRRLEHAADFRLRVQAALDLGKSADPEAMQPLVAALADKSAAVRAAAAAALKVLGDPAAVPALRERRNDRSQAVRAEVEGALTVLEAPSAERKPRVLVQLGAIRNGTRVRSRAVESQILVVSRKKLEALPGIDVLPGDDAATASGVSQEVPVVMVTTSIEKLSAAREGDTIVYSARVEYILQTMPDRVIAARVSGTASASASPAEAKDTRRSAELRHSVLEAAVHSAVQRAPKALLAAARL